MSCDINPMHIQHKDEIIWLHSLNCLCYHCRFCPLSTGCKIEKYLEPSSSPPNYSKDYLKLLLMLISINWPSLVASWVVVQKIYSKMYLGSCTNDHCDVTDLVNHGMVKNTKAWTSWEQNIMFLRNKKNINLWEVWEVIVL